MRRKAKRERKDSEHREKGLEKVGNCKGGEDPLLPPQPQPYQLVLVVGVFPGQGPDPGIPPFSAWECCLYWWGDVDSGLPWTTRL